jgi:hypothetical protein
MSRLVTRDRSGLAAVAAVAAAPAEPNAPSEPSWAATVARCGAEAGPFDAGLLDAWGHEIETVQARVGALDAAAGSATQRGAAPDGRGDALPGRYALVALAAARSGGFWSTEQLVAVGAAVELAYQATRHHDEVRDRGDQRARDDNRRHVLDGDWSITQAAVLVADIGPEAYRVLVRGYGAAQVARFAGRSPAALLASALALGHLVAGVRDGSAISAESVGARVYRWAIAS